MLRRKFVVCSSKQVALEECPWASKVEPVVGGYFCYESGSDYDIAKRYNYK